jgi:hypothetical protein
MQNEMIIPYELTDQCDQPNDKPHLPIKIVGNGGQILIGFEGYGEHGADVEHATPVLIEVWDGKLRVIVFGDINNEDPTHTIEMEGARESNRQSGCPVCGKPELKFPYPNNTHCSAECYLTDKANKATT